MERHPSLDDRFDPAVRIAEHDPRWAGWADAELSRIAEALGPLALRLEHIGSTAVPGLAAKPILDLQLSVTEIEPRQLYVEPLESLGYLFAPDPASPDRHSSRSNPSVRARITCMSAPPEATTSSGTWSCATSCVPVRRRRRVTRP